MAACLIPHTQKKNIKKNTKITVVEDVNEMLQSKYTYTQTGERDGAPTVSITL
jgi:hypothetical protein